LNDTYLAAESHSLKPSLLVDVLAIARIPRSIAPLIARTRYRRDLWQNVGTSRLSGEEAILVDESFLTIAGDMAVGKYQYTVALVGLAACSQGEGRELQYRSGRIQPCCQ
jgi:hypothetical protein